MSDLTMFPQTWSGWHKVGKCMVNEKYVGKIYHVLVADPREFDPSATHVHYMRGEDGTWLVASIKQSYNHPHSRGEMLRRINALFGGDDFDPANP